MSEAQPIPVYKENPLKLLFKSYTDPQSIPIKAKSLHGDIFKLNLFGGQRVILITSPEIISLLSKHLWWTTSSSSNITTESKHPMVKCAHTSVLFSEGYFHRKEKENFGKNFSPENLDTYVKLFTENYQNTVIPLYQTHGLDVSGSIKSLLVKSISQWLFGQDLTQKETRILIKSMKRILEFQKNKYVLGKYAYLLLYSSINFWRSRSIVQKLIGEKTAKLLDPGKSNVGFVSNFLESCPFGSEMKYSMSKLTDDWAASLVAGVDTVASALVWAIRILLERPDIIDKIREETNRMHFSKENCSKNYKELAYCRCVFLEALRLFPPFPTTTKQLLEEVIINNYKIPAKSWLTIPIVTIQRDPRWFNNPNEFNPDRWKDNDWGLDKNHAFMPFGFGHHRCVGWELAIIEGSLLLALLYSEYNVTSSKKLKSKPPVKLPYQVELSLTLRDHLSINLAKIK